MNKKIHIHLKYYYLCNFRHLHKRDLSYLYYLSLPYTINFFNCSNEVVNKIDTTTSFTFLFLPSSLSPIAFVIAAIKILWVYILSFPKKQRQCWKALQRCTGGEDVQGDKALGEKETRVHN